MIDLRRWFGGSKSTSGARINVLFVCMGNICRSPTAEAVFRHKVALIGKPEELGCDSAGTTDGHRGEAPDGRAQATARKRGYEMARLRARQVMAEDFSRFDLLLAMDRHNLVILQELAPEGLAGKAGLFMRYARHHEALEVPDPYYGNARGFDVVLDMIEDACDGLIDHLLATPGMDPRGPLA